MDSSSSSFEEQMIQPMDLRANIECLYSTSPKKTTDPRISYEITLSNFESLNIHNHNNNNKDDEYYYYYYYGFMQRRMHIILCYKKPNNNEEYNGLHIGGRLKESLAVVLDENPVMAGRIRRSENGDLEIVSNDSGVRCVEVQMPLNLVDLLESKEKMNQVEDKLVYWQDVEKPNPQFSPLLYVQVTKFQCGGYSLGISCSLLLSDPSNMTKFLKRWAEIHRSMAPDSQVPRSQIPNNYVLNFKSGFSKRLKNGTIHKSATNTTTSKSMIFNISIEENLIHYSRDEICKHFMLLCLKEAESKFGTKMTSNFALITKEPNGDAKVELLSKDNLDYSSPKHFKKYELNCVSWEDLRINETDFLKENGMVDASIHWTTCDALEGVVLVVISSPTKGKSDIKVYITFPGHQEIKR